MLARWPRPKRERLPDVTRPDRETPPPAFFAAASTCAMKGRACCARVDRMRPGRMRNSLLSDMMRPRTVQNSEEKQKDRRGAHGARKRYTVRIAPKT
jgi:hypothetical protein